MLGSLAHIHMPHQHDSAGTLASRPQGERLAPAAPKATAASGSYQQGATSHSRVSASSTTSQCQATMKSGRQCSRKATKGSFCWQHG